MSAFSKVIYALDGAGCSHKRTGENAAEAQCPAHEDGQASLCLGVGEKGVLLKCQAGCETADVVAALGLKMSDLFDEPSNGNGHRQIAATYDYSDEAGELLFQVVRFEPKDFRQRRPDGSGGWTWKLGNTRRVLYRLPKVIAAVKAGKPVYVVEGEKDVEAVERAGGAATTCPGGAGKWKPVYNEFFKGARVTIVADKDAPGRKHAAKVAKALDGVAAEVNIVEAVEGKDAADHLAAGRGLGEFVLVADDVWRQASATSSPSATKTPHQQADVADVADVADSRPEREKAPPSELLPAADLLERVLLLLRRYVVLPSDAARHALALYVLHTWAIEGAHATPYMLIVSPEKQAGKSRLLEVLELLVRQPWPCLSASEAALFRRIERDMPTLLLDEIDAIFKSSNEATEPIRAVLNGGNRRAAKATRCVGKGSEMQVVDFAIFSAKVLSGIDCGNVPETVVDRSVVVHMQRRRPDEKVERLRMRFAEKRVQQLRGALERWAAEHVEALAAAEPDLPDELSDRQADGWEPLLAIADVAGDPWPQRARDAARSLAVAETTASRGAMLLAAIRDAMGDASAITTADVLTAVNDNDELPFGGWSKGAGLDARGLAQLLRPYAVKSKSVRIGGKTPKGFTRSDLEDAFARYLTTPGKPQQPQHHNNKPQQQAENRVAANVADEGDVADKSATNGLGDELVASFYGKGAA